MTNDYYSHGVLILPVALYLTWRRLANDPASRMVEEQVDLRGAILLIVALPLYLFAVNQKTYYLAALTIPFMAAALIWFMVGLGTFRKLMFPLAFLLLMVPLPFIERATYPLAIFTGICSTSLVRLLGLEITVIGNAVQLPNADLLIGPQCSGINSIIALTALNALVAYVMIGPFFSRLLLVILAVPIAMLGNILRVANLLFVARYYGGDAAFTFYHDYSGIVFFVVVLVLLMPLTRWLRMRSLRLDVI